MLIVGADGLLGSSLLQHWLARGVPVAGTTRRPEAKGGEGEIIRFDLAAPAEQWPHFPRCNAAVVCAGVTNGEQCRRDPEGTRRINVRQTLRLAEMLSQQGIFVVFISTNLVFDGTKPLRRANEVFSPMTEYGRQKADVEKALAGLDRPGAVVRLTKVFHPGMALVRGWQRDLEQQRLIAPFDDLVCAPISLAAVVAAITTIAERCRSGVWQLSACTDISYADVARTFAREKNFDGKLICPVSCRSRGDLEHVPLHTTLDTMEAENTFGFKAEDPVEVVQRMFTA